MLDIKDQISKEMSQIKNQVYLFGNEIQEFKDQRTNRFLNKMENEKPSSAKKTTNGKCIYKNSKDLSLSSEEEQFNDLILKHQNLESKLNSIEGTINTILNNFFNSFIKGKHVQYKSVELEEKYRKTDYEGNDDDTIDQ
ncbi:hypothetical protein RCL_jg19419.t1 [Rhizophagus clarus]|uniref:Uncharacterized protein n=1 Tax=Rhizophagus clarus TaxID=94130 RepID=A0A8H3QW37_9GLOM|nr:hypothetical protein RCL_jg19419.t1 [Rhizophagus clarus]